MPTLTSGALAILVATTVLWFIGLLREDVSIVDSFWGLGFALLGWIYVLMEGSLSARGLILVTLVTCWGVRLSVHITLRNRGAGEDYRYRAIRAKWGPGFRWTSLGIVFWLQGLLMWVIAMPTFVAARTSGVPLGALDVLGICVFVIGFAFEVIGDWQLTRFKASPDSQGRTLQTGLWRYTRHPNYFGDATLWWGVYLMSVSAGGAWTVFSPLLMTFLLVRISGVPLLEERMSRSRPDFADYVERTSPFIPWPPRSSNPEGRAGAR